MALLSVRHIPLSHSVIRRLSNPSVKETKALRDRKLDFPYSLNGCH